MMPRVIVLRVCSASAGGRVGGRDRVVDGGGRCCGAEGTTPCAVS